MRPTAMVSGPRVIVALDYPTVSGALAFVDTVSPELCRLKVGFELFTAAGPKIVSDLSSRGFDVFLDLKYHDIPNTVAKSCAIAAKLGAWMINVHTLGGYDMLCAAREAIDNSGQDPLLIGVTLLTSHTSQDLADIGLDPDPVKQSLRLAVMAKKAGLDGVVCSAHEATALRETHGPDFCLVTPGIRPAGDTAGDQKRIMTPLRAVQSGAHYLVVGRPITTSKDPLGTLATINQELRTI